jgi:hypothetical protein
MAEGAERSLNADAVAVTSLAGRAVRSRVGPMVGEPRPMWRDDALWGAPCRPGMVGSMFDDDPLGNTDAVIGKKGERSRSGHRLDPVGYTSRPAV